MTLTKTSLVVAIADAYLVKLAADPVQQLLQNVDVARAALQTLSAQYKSKVEQDWLSAGQAALTHLNLVLQNNPNKPIEQILARPDVQDAMSVPFAAAGTATQQAIQDAWNDGVGVGQSQATSDLSVLGIPDVLPSESLDSSSYLNDVLADVQTNANAARERLVKAIQSAPKGQISGAMTKVINDLSNRSKAGVDVAISRGSTEAKLAKYQKAQQASGKKIMLLWVTHFRPTTCPTCAALHGKVVPLGGTFSSVATYKGKVPKVYGNLDGPPRHPNCGCQIVAYVVKDGPTTPKTMKLFSQNWWDQNKGGK